MSKEKSISKDEFMSLFTFTPGQGAGSPRKRKVKMHSLCEKDAKINGISLTTAGIPVVRAEDLLKN